MRRATPLGVALALAAVSACGPAPGGRGYTLLFFGRSPAARVGEYSWAPDADHSRLVAFDSALRVARTITNSRLATPLTVQRVGARLLVGERTGEGVVFDTSGAPVREWASPFPVSLYATDGRARIVAARSPYFVQFVAENGSQPLLWMLDTLGRLLHPVGATHLPQVPYLAQLVNAGAAAVGPDGAIYFAPLVRDEIVKLDATGATLWRVSRGLYPREEDPHFLPSTGPELRVAYPVVNIALALGPPPDGHLYVLGGADSGATRLRLDVLDPGTGKTVTTRVLNGPAAAIAIDRRGTLRILSTDSLLGVEPRGRREAFEPAFALPNLRGDTVRLAAYRGKVTLVNFWASWCDPCRAEFPLMGELYREFDRRDFDVAAISDDVDAGKMRDFVQEFRPPFPILVGGGRMKGVYHYRGLPYSVLLDRDGKIIERIFGFGGAGEFRRLHETIAQEIRGP